MGTVTGTEAGRGESSVPDLHTVKRDSCTKKKTATGKWGGNLTEERSKGHQANKETRRHWLAEGAAAGRRASRCPVTGVRPAKARGLETSSVGGAAGVSLALTLECHVPSTWQGTLAGSQAPPRPAESCRCLPCGEDTPRPRAGLAQATGLGLRNTKDKTKAEASDDFEHFCHRPLSSGRPPPGE